MLGVVRYPVSHVSGHMGDLGCSLLSEFVEEHVEGSLARALDNAGSRARWRARWSLWLELICVVTTGSVKPTGTFGSGNHDRREIRFDGADAGLDPSTRRGTE